MYFEGYKSKKCERNFYVLFEFRTNTNTALKHRPVKGLDRMNIIKSRKLTSNVYK